MFESMPEINSIDVRKSIDKRVSELNSPLLILQKIEPFLKSMDGKKWNNETTIEFKKMFPLRWCTVDFNSNYKAALRIWDKNPSDYNAAVSIVLFFSDDGGYLFSFERTFPDGIFYGYRKNMDWEKNVLSKYEKLVSSWNIGINRMKELEKDIYELNINGAFRI